MRHASLFVFLAITLVPCLDLISGVTTSTLSPPAQTNPADKTSERLDSLETHTKELDDKIDRATLKNDYTQQIQKQYETYYQKAFSTQIQIFSVLGIILTLLTFF